MTAVWVEHEQQFCIRQTEKSARGILSISLIFSIFLLNKCFLPTISKSKIFNLIADFRLRAGQASRGPIELLVRDKVDAHTLVRD